ncbi:MAG: stage II sporulation protein E [Sarcina sp.]
MQYGADVKNYVRSNSQKNISASGVSVDDNYIKLIFIAISSVFLSRVYFKVDLAFIQNIAPLGILFVLSVCLDDIKSSIIALVSCIIGYVSISKNIEETSTFIILGIGIVAYNFLVQKKSKQVKIVGSFILSVLIFFIAGIFIDGRDYFSSLYIASIITLIMIPAFFIVSYSYRCINNFKLESYINNDELISIEILIALVIVGFGNIGIFNVQLLDILAIFFVFFISFVGRENLGVTSGIILGLVCGIITNKMGFYLVILGVGSLVVTLFRESGKFISYMVFNISVLLLAVYMKEFNIYTLIEILVGSTAILFIPSKLIKRVRVELDSNTKRECDGEKHFNKVKAELMFRLNDFTGVLATMGSTLGNMVENESLVSQNKGEELVDNLADRVCSTCDYKSTCWRRELHETYSSFRELIQSYEEGECKFPMTLKKKCLKEAALLRETEEVVNKHIADELLKKRLSEGRRILASHIKNMSDTIKEIVDDFDSEVVLDLEIERTVKKTLLRNNIKFYDLIAYSDKDGRINIKVEMNDCGGCNFCVKTILPLLNNVIGRKLCMSNECRISARTGRCDIHIQEAPKFKVVSSIALSPKDGEKYIGDSYSFGKTRDGNHMVLLCDGMGTGARAGAESKMAVEMIEKFSEGGFSEKTAINTINSIMNIKFSEEERFSTLDMQKINLYDGSVKFLKVGAMESFIKRGNKVRIIDSKTLPFGVLDKPDIDENTQKIKGGDFIITITDGILDLFKDGDLNNKWLMELLEETNSKVPKDLANEILDKAKSFNNGKAKDDMTVIVSKIYNA